MDKGDRAYLAPLAVETTAVEANPNAVIAALAAESNDLIDPAEGDV